jgi:two-component system response regulator AlgR
VRILVVDDEPLARERLVRLLQRLRPDDELCEAADGEAAITTARAFAPDLVLLDVRMPGRDGIEVAAELDTLDNPPAIAFCTAYDEYALQAFQYHAVAYLLKPARAEDLAACLRSASRVNRAQLARLRESPPAQPRDDGERVSSHTHRGFESLPLTEVRCFIAEDKYVSAIAPDTELTLSETLKDLEERFGDRFVRTHRNALVALGHIERLERCKDGGWQVRLRDCDLSPAISRRHLSAVKRRFSGKGD